MNHALEISRENKWRNNVRTIKKQGYDAKHQGKEIRTKINLYILYFFQKKRQSYNILKFRILTSISTTHMFLLNFY